MQQHVYAKFPPCGHREDSECSFDAHGSSVLFIICTTWCYVSHIKKQTLSVEQLRLSQGLSCLMSSPQVRVQTLCAVTCKHACNINYLFSAAATCYHNNLCRPAARYRNKMPLDRDTTDTPMKRIHPSLMTERWRDWATVAWWSGRQPFNSLTFQQLIIIVCGFPVTWISQFMLVVQSESLPAGQQLIHDIQKQGVYLEDFPKS